MTIDETVSDLIEKARKAVNYSNKKDAIDFLSDAIELDKCNVKLYIFRSTVYASHNQIDEAVKDTKDAIDPKNISLRLHLAEIYVQKANWRKRRAGVFWWGDICQIPHQAIH
jgi:predicted Zn-dependent protease